MAYTAWSVVFGEQPSAAKWNILGTNDASFNDGTGIAAGAITPEKLVSGNGTSWTLQTWTPSWTNLTIGNATVNAKYCRIGNLVFFRLKLVWGNTTSATASAVRFSLPVNLNSVYSDNDIIAYGSCLDVGIAAYFSWARFATASTLDVMVGAAGSTYLTQNNMTSTAPFTWATGDILNLSGTYEVA